MKQTFTLASQFITSCPPSNPHLGLTAYPPLIMDGTFTSNETAFPGQTANVEAPNATYIMFVANDDGEPVFAPIENNTVVFPENLAGEVFAMATTNGTDSSDSYVVAGPAVLLFDRYSNYTLIN